MFIDDLKKSILQKAIQGKLVEQNPNDEPASQLLKRIREEKEKLIKDGKIKKEKSLSPITEEEKTFDIPNSWEWVRLGDVVSIFGRIGFRGYTTADIVPEGKGAITISPSNIKGYKTEFIKNTYVSREKYEQSPEIMTYEGDLILVKTGSSYGKCGIVENLPEKATLNPQLVVLKYITTDRKFLLYALNSSLSRNQYEKFVIGTAIPTFSQEKLKSLIIPLPPLEEQKRIVAKLDELMPLLDEARPLEEEITKLEKDFPSKLRQSILQYAIQGKLVEQNSGDEPASELLKKIKEEKEKLIKEGKIKKEKPLEPIKDEEKLFEIPSSWEWVRLGEIFDVTMGQSPEGTSIGTNVNGMEFHQGKIYFSDKLIQNSGIQTNQITKIAHPSSILLCMRAPVGKVNITDREICIGRGLSSLFPLGGISLDYAFYVLQALEFEFIKKSTGSTFKAITGDVVKEQVFPLPPLEEQKRIVAKLDELMKLCDELEEQIG